MAWHGLRPDARVVAGHGGDSRLYLIWDGKLRKLTSDHSPVGEREDQGEIREQEAMAHPRRNQVFRDVGSRWREAGEDDFIEIHGFPFRPDVAFLLCSDGRSDSYVQRTDLSSVRARDGPADIAAQIATFFSFLAYYTLPAA